MRPSNILPTANQFRPLDGTIRSIAVMLFEANLQTEIPLTIKMQERRYVLSSIEGPDFYFWFGRGVNSNDASTIVIPGYQLDLFDDESGPKLYVYVGDDWNRDRQEFIHGTKIHARMEREPRRYLVYKGSNFPDRDATISGYRRPFLLPWNNLGRQYDPGENDAPFYETQQVLDVMSAWLRANVLETLLAEKAEREAAKEQK